MSKIKSVYSIISYAIYGAVCFSLPVSLVMIVGIWVHLFIIIMESEVWTIYHCLGLSMKHWYALYVLLCCYDVFPLVHTIVYLFGFHVKHSTPMRYKNSALFVLYSDDHCIMTVHSTSIDLGIPAFISCWLLAVLTCFLNSARPKTARNCEDSYEIIISV